MSPNAEDHETYLDIEPMTGLFVRAKKRLQLNYFISNWYCPNISTDVVTEMTSICATEGLNTSDCFDTLHLMQCLSTESNWRIYNNGSYYPYAWAEESFTLSKNDAEDLKSSLFVITNLSTQLGLWSFIAAGIVFALLLGVLYERSKHVAENIEEANRQIRNSDDSDIFANKYTGQSDLIKSLIHG